MFNFFKKSNAIKKAEDDIKKKYQDLIAALQGTDEEKEAQTKVLEAQRDEELAGAEKKVDEERNPQLHEGKEVKVEFTVKQFLFEGKIYTSSDIEEAAAGGDQEAVDFINKLIDIKAGVIKQVPVNE